MTSRSLLRYLVPILALALMTACEKSDNQQLQADVNSASRISINLLSKKMLSELIESRHGKVLLVNVWATWCVPCREEFPDLIRLAKEFRHKNVDIIIISADYPDEIDSKIRPFLEKQGAEFPAYVQNFKKQEDFINFLNSEWSGALPATFIYDQHGNQKNFLLGKHTYQEFEQALMNLL